MDPNLPATTEPSAVPAIPDAAAEPAPTPQPRQNVTTGLFPLALGVLVIAFAALALWTLMATAGVSP